MAAHRKFTFDNPEDSYWNENGGKFAVSDAFFDEPAGAALARAALDDLYDSKSRCGHGGAGDDASSTAGSSERGGGADSNSTVDLMSNSPKRPDFFADGPAATPLQRFVASNMTGTTAGTGTRRITAGPLTTTEMLAVASGYSLDPSGSPRINNLNTSFDNGPASVLSEGAASVGSFSSESTTQLDYSRLKAEHRKLQRHFENMRLERYRAPDVDETVRRLMRGEPTVMELYRTKREKLALLDAAIELVDGNVIIAVVLFLRRTLSDAIFRDILLLRQPAASHYVALLKEQGNFEELTHTLFALGRTDDAAMVELGVAIKKRTPEQRVSEVRKALQSGFSDPHLSADAKRVANYVNLLERQIPIDAADEDTVKQGKSDHFKEFPKAASLIGQPALTTLYYSCLYHYDLPVNSFASPLSIRELCAFTDKQFVWMATKALARQKRWLDVERLMTSKKMLGGVKLVCPFAWPHLFQIMAKAGGSEGAPKEYLLKFLRAVPEPDERLALAEQYDVPEMVIDCLVVAKDRQRLAAYANRLTPHTNDAYKAQAALNNKGYKWKN